MIEVVPGSELVSKMLDPEGPIQWINDKFLLGRSITNKNMLAVVGFAGKCEVVIKLEVFFDPLTPIDYISEIYENDSREKFVKVVNRKRLKVHVINLNSKSTEDFNFYSKSTDIYKDPEFLHEIISPRGHRVAIRHLDTKTLSICEIKRE
jgi:hypothetical protein